jgi:hypothetical protein
MGFEDRLRDHLHSAGEGANLAEGSLGGVQQRSRDRVRRHRAVAGGAMASAVAVVVGAGVFSLRAGTPDSDNFAIGAVTTVPFVTTSVSSPAASPSPSTSALAVADSAPAPPTSVSVGNVVPDVTTSDPGGDSVALIAAGPDGVGAGWSAAVLPTANDSEVAAVTVDRYVPDATGAWAQVGGEWFGLAKGVWESAGLPVEGSETTGEVVAIDGPGIDGTGTGTGTNGGSDAAGRPGSVVTIGALTACGDTQLLSSIGADEGSAEALPLRQLGRSVTVGVNTQLALGNDLAVVVANTDHHFDPACLASDLDVEVSEGGTVELVESALVVTDSEGLTSQTALVDFELSDADIVTITADPRSDTVFLVRPTGEERWRSQTVEGMHTARVAIVNGQPFLALSANGGELWRLDTDLTWSTLELPVEGPLGVSIDGSFVAVWTRAVLFASDDLGQNWTELKLPTALEPSYVVRTASGYLAVGSGVDGESEIAETNTFESGTVVAQYDGGQWIESSLMEIIGVGEGVVDVVGAPNVQIVITTPKGLMVFALE